MKISKNTLGGLAIGAALALAGMAGCAHFHDRPLSSEQTLANFEARSLDAAGLRAFIEKNREKAGAGAWDLDRLAFVAFYFHPDLDVARAQLAGAQAAQITAGERPNPTLGAGLSYNTTTGIPSPWIISPSLDIPIETAGKRGYRLAQASHLSDAARFNLATTAWQVRSRVRKSLLALYGASEREAALGRLAAIQGESARLLEAQLQAGEVSPFEVSQSRVASSQARLAVREAARQAAVSRVQLADALGLPPRALDGADVKLDFGAFEQSPPDVPDAAARKQALLNRPDLLAALAEYAAAQSALQLEIARQYPDVRIGPGYEYDQGDNKWGVGLSLELPVLNRNKGRIAEAGAKRNELAAKFNALQARVISEIAQAAADYRASVGKLAAAAALDEELSRQLRAAQGMLDAGQISRVEFSQRQIETVSAALAQLDARLQAQEALGALEGAMQSPAAIAAVSAQTPREEAVSASTQSPRDGDAAMAAAAPAATDAEPPAAPSSLVLPALARTIPLPRVKGGFDLMAIDIAGVRLFLNAEDNNTTEVVDLAAGRLAHTITDVVEPKWVVYRPELRRLYIANGNGDVRVFDSDTFALQRTIAFREKANNLRFDAKTRELFVGVGANFGAIGVVDTRTDTITAQIPLADFPKQFEVEDEGGGGRIFVNVPRANHVAVIDRDKKTVAQTWPVAASTGNIPMCLDRAHRRLFIGCETGKLVVLDTDTGAQIAALAIAGGADGIYYDARRRQIYVSCGDGSLDVVRQADADSYEFAGRVPTVAGAATSLFVPELDQLFLAVPQRGAQAAELRIYTINPTTNQK